MTSEARLIAKNWVRFWGMNGAAYAALILGYLVFPGGWVESTVTVVVGGHAVLSTMAWLMSRVPIPHDEEAYRKLHALSLEFLQNQVGIPRVAHVLYDLGGALFLLGVQRYGILILWLIQMLATFGCHSNIENQAKRSPFLPKENNDGSRGSQEIG